MDELNAGHQNLKAGQENGLKWDASRKFFRTIGLIQVYPLLHHDFPPISMANFNGHSMVDGFALRFLKSAHLMESCYPSGPCKSCCAFEKRTDANSTQCDPFQPVVKVLISVCVCIYIYKYILCYILSSFKPVEPSNSACPARRLFLLSAHVVSCGDGWVGLAKTGL